LKLYGVEFEVKNLPPLDKEYIPLAKFNEAFLKTAKKPLNVAVERNDGLVSVFKTFVHGTEDMREADCFYVERLVKFLLWSKGGFKVFICGDNAVADYVKAAYAKGGKREFDFNFMSQVFEQPFEVVACAYEDTPAENENPKPLGRHLDGCRIGFDAGGSDRKVSAVIDGEPVYSEEVIWHPKTTADAQYHYDEIVSALKTAASKMPRVDAIGVSSAGIYINNQTKIASLFRKVPADQHEAIIKNIYINAAKEIGDIPVEVANDGDVTALAGSMSLNDNNILGIAMGTSQAGGYVDGKGYLTGWLNELAFTPIDATPNGPLDEWSGDIGCGVMYFSQDGVIRLAPLAGVELDENATPAEKLAFVQEEVKKGNENADKIFEAIGVCLGHAVAQYSTVYDIKHVLLMGRVVSGKGGQLILDNTNKVLAEEYPAVAAKTEVTLPDEKSRRVGQSVAAASLPSI